MATPGLFTCPLDRGHIKLAGAFIWCTNMKKKGATNRALC